VGVLGTTLARFVDAERLDAAVAGMLTEFLCDLVLAGVF
jgi:hypothetical protein